MLTKVHLRLPEQQEAVVNLSLVPKTGETIEFGGQRYVVISVVHAIESSQTTIDLVRITPDDVAGRLRLNESVRYRTTEIRAYSPPARPRMLR